METSIGPAQKLVVEAPALSNREKVFNAIRDLCNVGKQASRLAISRDTGLKMSIVDEHVKNLKASERIRLVVNGVFEPVEYTVDRTISGSIVSGGGYVLQIGELTVKLTLREARNVGTLTAGLGMLFGR